MSTITSEKEFHNKRFGSQINPRAAAAKYYAVAGNAKQYFNKLIAEKAKPGATLLEYGCGTGGDIVLFHHLGFSITGIDISEEGIQKAQEKAAEKSIAADYLVMNAEETIFPENKFDLVVGTGILHHLEFKKSLAELARILKFGGSAVFIEPLGHNVFINFYRRITPAMRTKDEHPLRASDLAIMKDYFETVKTKYFSLFAFLAMPLRGTPLFRFFRPICDFLDRVIFAAFPFIRRYAWMVVIDLSGPRHNTNRNQLSRT